MYSSLSEYYTQDEHLEMFVLFSLGMYGSSLI